jgi:hypothetical protein
MLEEKSRLGDNIRSNCRFVHSKYYLTNNKLFYKYIKLKYVYKPYKFIVTVKRVFNSNSGNRQSPAR